MGKPLNHGETSSLLYSALPLDRSNRRSLGTSSRPTQTLYSPSLLTNSTLTKMVFFHADPGEVQSARQAPDHAKHTHTSPQRPSRIGRGCRDTGSQGQEASQRS
jgi:hypothetical protein